MHTVGVILVAILQAGNHVFRLLLLLVSRKCKHCCNPASRQPCLSTDDRPSGLSPACELQSCKQATMSFDSYPPSIACEALSIKGLREPVTKVPFMWMSFSPKYPFLPLLDYCESSRSRPLQHQTLAKLGQTKDGKRRRIFTMFMDDHRPTADNAEAQH